MSARTVLLEAADHIEEVGWIQGAAFEDPNDISTACCAVGALTWATRFAVRSVYIDALGELQFYVDGSVPQWNDAPERTKDEVVAALRAAADAAGVGR